MVGVEMLFNEIVVDRGVTEKTVIMDGGDGNDGRGS